jgi:hypothetical protein
MGNERQVMANEKYFDPYFFLKEVVIGKYIILKVLIKFCIF